MIIFIDQHIEDPICFEDGENRLMISSCLAMMTFLQSLFTSKIQYDESKCISINTLILDPGGERFKLSVQSCCQKNLYT